LYADAMKTDPRASITPSKTPPTTLPGIEPSPPMTMISNPLKVEIAPFSR